MWTDAGTVDRVPQVRDQPEAIGDLWRRPDARVIVISERGEVSVRATEVEERHWLSTYSTVDTELAVEHTQGAWHSQKHLLLGLVHGEPRFVVVRPGVAGTGLRELLPRLSHTDQELAVMAAAITSWHRMNPHCPACGGTTRIILGGMARHCDSCSNALFPRHDPAIIVAIVDEEDRLLLGRQATWPGGRYSILAGFVEAGESLEHCVQREVREEVGLEVHSLRYVGSQPWPFPRSLMCAFVARPSSTDITVDGSEIVDAQFFTREDLEQRLADGTMTVAGGASVSGHLINAWRHNTLAEFLNGDAKPTAGGEGRTRVKRGW